MTERSIRRAAERKARKEAIKASRAQIMANQANAQHSTGPKTEAGKEASSQNRRTYGLTGAFVVLPHEDENEYFALHDRLVKEHQPATETEKILVKKMAQHQWLADRALYQQANCFYIDDFAIVEKQLSLFMRYHTQHNRAFHKALTELQKTQKERQQQTLQMPRLKAQSVEVQTLLNHQKLIKLRKNGFESQNPEEAPKTTPPTRFESPELTPKEAPAAA